MHLNDGKQNLVHSIFVIESTKFNLRTIWSCCTWTDSVNKCQSLIGSLKILNDSLLRVTLRWREEPPPGRPPANLADRLLVIVITTIRLVVAAGNPKVTVTIFIMLVLVGQPVKQIVFVLVIEPKEFCKKKLIFLYHIVNTNLWKQEVVDVIVMLLLVSMLPRMHNGPQGLILDTFSATRKLLYEVTSTRLHHGSRIIVGV